MAQKYRTQSEADLYHITARGAGQQILFEDDADRKALLHRMCKLLDEYGGEIYAWCFMDNHFHLIIRLKLDLLSKMMQRTEFWYAQYYNRKYLRKGPLFQGRFDSVPISSDEQLMKAVRYIHRNPAAVGVVDLGKYAWSSYREYLGTPSVTSTELVLELFGGIEGMKGFHEWEGAESSAAVVKPETKHRLTDSEALKFAKQLLGIRSPSSLAAMGKAARNMGLAHLKANGLTIRQISRLTGIGRGIVQRA